MDLVVEEAVRELAELAVGTPLEGAVTPHRQKDQRLWRTMLGCDRTVGRISTYYYPCYYQPLQPGQFVGFLGSV